MNQNERKYQNERKSAGLSAKRAPLRRAVNLLLTAVLASTMLAACSGGNTNNNGNAGQTGSQSGGTSGGSQTEQQPSNESASDPIEIQWGIHFQSEGVIANTKVQQWLEEKFNVVIKPVKITDASIASGEVPDIFTLGDPSNVAAYQAQGVLMEVDPAMLTEKMPEFMTDLTSVDEKLLQPATFNDKLWAIPMFITLRPYDFALLWNETWLNNVGIDEVPQTLEQFEEAVYAFRNNDPDGNGQKDTYGLTGTMTTTWSSGFYSIFGAFGVEPTMWMEREGQIVNGSVLPEAKQALELLAKWYADGVIDPEFITDTQENYRNKLHNGRVGVIEETIQNMATEKSSTNVNFKAVNPDSATAIGPNPEGPGGHGSWNWGSKSNYIVFGKQVADQPEKLEKLLEILRAQSIDDEVFAIVNHGFMGEQWQYEGGAETPGPVEYLSGYEKVDAREQVGVRLFALGNIQTLDMRETYMSPAVVDALTTYGSGDNWTDAIYFMALPSDSRYKEDLKLLMQRYYAEFITGQRSLDDFDRYVEEWHSLGGTLLTEEANEVYATLGN